MRGVKNNSASNLIVLKDVSRIVLFKPYPVIPIVHGGSIWDAEFVFPTVLEHHNKNTTGFSSPLAIGAILPSRIFLHLVRQFIIQCWDHHSCFQGVASQICIN